MDTEVDLLRNEKLNFGTSEAEMSTATPQTIQDNIMDIVNESLIYNNVDNNGLTLSQEIGKELSTEAEQGHDSNTNLNCFICDARVKPGLSYNIFSSVLSQTGSQLCDAVNKALKINLVTSDAVRCTELCNICFDLFDELEMAEQQCTTLRNALVSDYRKTCELYNQVVAEEEVVMVGVACQTDNSDWLSTVKVEEVLAKPKARKCAKRGKKVKMKRKGKNIVSDEDSEQSEEEDRSRHEELIDYDQVECKPDPDNEELDISGTETRRKTHHCDHCSRSFRRSSELENHVRVKHRNQTRNECPHCCQTFNSVSGLRVHVKKKHRKDETKDMKSYVKEYSQHGQSRKRSVNNQLKQTCS